MKNDKNAKTVDTVHTHTHTHTHLFYKIIESTKVISIKN